MGLNMAERPPGKVCAVCGRVLDIVFDSGVFVGYEHTRYDLERGVNHRPVPIDYGSPQEILRCDFCLTDNPEYVVPVKTFPAMYGATSIGDWAACSKCAKLIQSNSWETLLRRVAHVSPAGKMLGAATVIESLRPVYRTLRANMTGPVRRRDA